MANQYTNKVANIENNAKDEKPIFKEPEVIIKEIYIEKPQDISVYGLSQYLNSMIVKGLITRAQSDKILRILK